MKILRNKQIKEIISRVAANHIITLDALNKAHNKDAISVEQYADSVQHLTDNTVEVVIATGGIKGLAMVNGLIESKMRKLYGTKDRRNI